MIYSHSVLTEINFFYNTNSFSFVLTHGRGSHRAKFYPQIRTCDAYRNHTQTCKNTNLLTGRNFEFLKLFCSGGAEGRKLLLVYQNKECRTTTLQVVKNHKKSGVQERCPCEEEQEQMQTCARPYLAKQ